MPIIVSIRDASADFHTITTVLQEAGYKQATLNDYSYLLEHRENKAYVGLDRIVTFEVSDHLSLSGLEKIRQTIIEINNRVNGTIVDGDYHLGYLADDETKASLFRNWAEWVSYLHGARFQTLKGNHVRVFTTGYQQLGEGVLEQYETGEDTEGIMRIISCRIATEQGTAETFSAEPYVIVEPSGQFEPTGH